MKMTTLGFAATAALTVALAGCGPTPSDSPPTTAPSPNPKPGPVASTSKPTPRGAVDVIKPETDTPTKAGGSVEKPPVVTPDVPLAKADPQLPKGEPLPDFPMTDPKNAKVPLTPD